MSRHSEPDAESCRQYRRLLMSGVVLGAVCIGLLALSQSFAWDSPIKGRPVWLFVGLMTVGFCVHLFALRAAIRLKSDSRVGWVVIWFALGFRLILLPSHPIQEIDVYRYMWDGAVLADGGNPYQFSPSAVRGADDATSDVDLQKAADLRDSSDSIRDTLFRIHYPQLTTIYPPVSQLVFAASAFASPVDASVPVRRTITKFFIVIFDVLTMLALLRLLKHFRMPAGWLICYAWSPLVLKEFANSGHLDAIAVAFTTWAIVYWLLAIDRRSLQTLIVAAGLLGLGIGAKLYPVVIVPVIAVSVFRHLGGPAFLLSALTLLVVSAMSLAPMVISESSDAVSTIEPESDDQSLEDESDSPPLPVDFSDVVSSSDQLAEAEPPIPLVAHQRRGNEAKGTDNGLVAFVSRWRMNDVIFLVINENLRPHSEAWFSVMPNTCRQTVRRLRGWWRGGDGDAAAFAVSRLVVACLHIGIVGWLSMLAWQAPLRQLPNLAFCSIAWFWLLLPTQNPWYWIWAMPLLSFAPIRSWIWMSGVLVIYYLRFWFANDVGDQSFAGTGYTGPMFFSFVVVWLEYLPLYLLLAWEWRQRRAAAKKLRAEVGDLSF